MATQIINVLDASAMTAYLKGEIGEDIVENILTDPDIDCFAHAINLCEVYYDAIRSVMKNTPSRPCADCSR